MWRPVPASTRTQKNRESAHLVLLCETQEGYQNLIKLVSAGFTQGYYYRPRIDLELLEEHAKGLIALSACLSGDIPRLVLAGRLEEAKAMARRYERIMGKGNYFLEIQDHGIQGERQVANALIQLSRELDIPWWPPTTCTTSASRTPPPRRCSCASKRARPCRMRTAWRCTAISST